MIGYGSQCGFSGVTGAKTVLIRRKEVVFGQVGLELLVNSSLYNFCNDRNNGDRTEVGWVGGIPGFKDRMYQGMFPGMRYVGLGNAGIDQMQ